MADPFVEKQLEALSPLKRVLGRGARINGLTAINNLLAAAASVEDVSLRQAEEAAAAHGLRLGARLRPERLRMASDFLNHCLRDRRLDDRELAQLRHLRRALRLRKEDVAEIQDQAVRAIYAKGVDGVLNDHRLDFEERKLLERLAEDLRLSAPEAAGIYASKAQEIVQGALDLAIEDQRLSPDEDAELARLAENLGVELSQDDESRRTLERFRTYWQLEEGTIQEVPVDINLQSSERCYLKVDVEWFEHQRVTRRFGHHAPTVRLKIVEGVYWRAGNMACAPTSEDVMKRVDAGTCYVTNQRLLFRGGEGNKSIPLDNILGVEAFGNGVEVEKDSGTSPFLQFDQGTEVFGLVVDRMLDDRV